MSFRSQTHLLDYYRIQEYQAHNVNMSERGSSLEYARVSVKDAANCHTLSKSNYVNATVTSSVSNFSSAGTLNTTTSMGGGGGGGGKMFEQPMMRSTMGINANTRLKEEKERNKWARSTVLLPSPETATTLAMSGLSRGGGSSSGSTSGGGNSGSPQPYSFLQAKYGGEEGYRRHLIERQSYYARLEKHLETGELTTECASLKSANDGDFVVNTKGPSPSEKHSSRGVGAESPKSIKLIRAQDRVFPTLDLHFYNCLYTHEHKSAPFYEDCQFDDDEMKLTSFVEHGVMFEPDATRKEDTEVVLDFFVFYSLFPFC